MRRRVVISFIACGCLLSMGIHAQQQKQTTTQKPAQKTPTQAAAAMVAAGQYEDALATITKALAMSPRDRDGVMVKLDALVGLDKYAEALDSYYAFIAATREQTDATLARHLARTSLHHEAVGNHPDAQPAAVEILRAAGETIGGPRKTSGGNASSANPKGAPVRDGGAGALKSGAANSNAANAGGPRPEEVLANSAASIEARRSALDRLTAPVSPQAQELVRAALKAPEPPIKLAAASAATRLDLRSAIPELRLAVNDQFLPVKLTAAATLRQWGDSAGNEVLFAALKADFLAGRLMAARALSATGDTSWPPQIAPLLESPRANERVAAADLLLKTPAYAEKAREILRTEMTGKEAPIRREAVRALASQADADPWTYLPMMRDADPVVRVYAAGVLMRKLPSTPAPVAAGRSPK